MRQESEATMTGFGTMPPPHDGAAQDVRVEVSRSRDAEFTAFVRDSGAYLHRTAYLLCGDPHRAEELVPDDVVADLRASGGLVSWTGTDTASQDPTDASYLYRATASASGHDGPDLARFPGWSVTAGMAGDRAAWLEDRGTTRWLVGGTVLPAGEG